MLEVESIVATPLFVGENTSNNDKRTKHGNSERMIKLQPLKGIVERDE